jgi:hypothetical protein
MALGKALCCFSLNILPRFTAALLKKILQDPKTDRRIPFTGGRILAPRKVWTENETYRGEAG